MTLYTLHTVDVIIIVLNRSMFDICVTIGNTTLIYPTSTNSYWFYNCLFLISLLLILSGNTYHLGLKCKSNYICMRYTSRLSPEYSC